MFRKSILYALPLFAAGVPAAAQAPDFSKVEVKAETLVPGVAVLFGGGATSGYLMAPTAPC